MTDSLSPAERSENMSRIRGRDTGPEKALRGALHRRGLRYRLNVRALPGRPDLVLAKHRAVIFVHGCFWHRHANCKYAYGPKSNKLFWLEKFRGNTRRDKQNSAVLQKLGWRVLIVWECALRRPEQIEKTAEATRKWLTTRSRLRVIGGRPRYI
jgi:DNA mismatch endonuclease (patch repair protein)